MTHRTAKRAPRLRRCVPCLSISVKRVGLKDNGDDLFWLPATSVVDWKQNIVATFDGSSEVGRVLFFNDLDALYEVVEFEDPAISAKAGGDPSEMIVALGLHIASDLLRATGLRAEGQNLRHQSAFEAYIRDRDFKRTGLKPLSIRLLLNKAQLPDLTEALSIIAERDEASVINPNAFFAQALGGAADMSRRPNSVAGLADAALADAFQFLNIWKVCPTNRGL